MVLGDFAPDLTCIFDLPPELGLTRAHKRSAADRFEQESLSFFTRARAVFLERAKHNPNRYWIVDATQSADTIQTQLQNRLASLLQN